MTDIKIPTVDMTSFDAFTKATLSAAESYFKSLGEFARLALTINPLLTAFPPLRQCNSCDIPPACWLPRSLGEIRSVVCPGGSASVRVQVTNCQPQTSNIEVAFPKSESNGKVTPTAATLGPYERTTFNASFSVPANAGKGQQFETLLWVLGCNAHYLRWIVDTAGGVSGSCHEISVEDCPDYVHHWYDHFYCDRGCFHTRLTTRD